MRQGDAVDAYACAKVMQLIAYAKVLQLIAYGLFVKVMQLHKAKADPQRWWMGEGAMVPRVWMVT